MLDSAQVSDLAAPSSSTEVPNAYLLPLPSSPRQLLFIRMLSCGSCLIPAPTLILVPHTCLEELHALPPYHRSFAPSIDVTRPRFDCDWTHPRSFRLSIPPVL